MTEDEMVGWHHQLNGREFEQTPGDSGGQGSLVCCSPCGHKELDMSEQLNNNRTCSAETSQERGPLWGRTGQGLACPLSSAIHRGLLAVIVSISESQFIIGK